MRKNKNLTVEFIIFMTMIIVLIMSPMWVSYVALILGVIGLRKKPVPNAGFETYNAYMRSGKIEL